FWVSLHHFPIEDISKTLSNISTMIKPGGLLFLFEPNGKFLPRYLIYNTPLKKLVYYDEERPVFIHDLASILYSLQLEPLFISGHNPPYNPIYLKKLPGGLIFFPFIEILYQVERLFNLYKKPWWNIKKQNKSFQKLMNYAGLYTLAIFKMGKNHKEII
ncbi:MAG: hypothetical protein HQK77_16345, partial [Desulfobacterales bacterium]|nr:hypothetical protein [Desulfobacterales bacterium]